MYFYEASVLVGYLLDLLNLSRNVEELKQRLVDYSNEFNFMDAFSIVQTNSGRSDGRVSQADFREALLLRGLKHDRLSMDRIYLFFRRYNQENDNHLTFQDFCQAICPINPSRAYKLGQRAIRNVGQPNNSFGFEEHTLDTYLRMLDMAIETEVQMECIR